MAAIDDVTKSILTGDSSVELALIFGSMAKGSGHPQSDVDIALAGRYPLPPEKLVDLATRLTLALGREVDLVDLNAVSSAILREALTNGRVLLNKNPELFGAIIKRMWYDQADMMPYVRRILTERRKSFLDEP